MAGKEDDRQGGEMGESTRQKSEVHMRTDGRKRAEEARLMVGGGSSVRVVGSTKKWTTCQKDENAPMGMRGVNRLIVGNNWSKSPRSFSLNSNFLRVRPDEPRQAGRA